MAISTTFSEGSLHRHAWQEGKCVYSWTRTEVETMHKEAPEAVWAWNGIPHWKRCETSNVQVAGSPASSASPRGLPGYAINVGDENG